MCENAPWLNRVLDTKGLKESTRCKRGGWGRAMYEIRLNVQEGLVKDFCLL